MTLPLYRLNGALPAISADGHRGLWFDKFCSAWPSEANWSLEQRKLTWLEGLSGSCGAPELLAEAAFRRVRLVENRGGQWGVLKTASRFVTGLGLSNPSENGFAWHPTLGVPYLPGSSVKGLVKATMSPGEKMFGSQRHIGTLAFLDAVPVGPVKTEVDVLTPHYAGWTPADPPGDWRSPIPIPFLTVASDQRFLFSIVPLRRVGEDGSDDADSAWAALDEALRTEGAGAKTAVGYGFFTRDLAGTKKLRTLLDRADARSDPGSSGAVEMLLLGKREQEILDIVRESLSESSPHAFQAGTLAEVLGDPAFLCRWRDHWETDYGARTLRQVNGSFIDEWMSKRAVDSETTTGGKKLKQRAESLRGRVGSSGGGGAP